MHRCKYRIVIGHACRGREHSGIIRYNQLLVADWCTNTRVELHVYLGSGRFLCIVEYTWTKFRESSDHIIVTEDLLKVSDSDLGSVNCRNLRLCNSAFPSELACIRCFFVLYSKFSLQAHSLQAKSRYRQSRYFFGVPIFPRQIVFVIGIGIPRYRHIIKTYVPITNYAPDRYISTKMCGFTGFRISVRCQTNHLSESLPDSIYWRNLVKTTGHQL